MRISRHQLFMEVAQVFAKRSTCARLAVGAVVVADRSIVAAGYNGSAAGEPHCTGKHCTPPGQGCQRALHAELNALSRIPTSVLGSPLDIYVTDSPCAHCYELIVEPMYHIRSLYFANLYRINQHLLDHSELSIFRLTPSGYVIDYRTGELVE